METTIADIPRGIFSKVRLLSEYIVTTCNNYGKVHELTIEPCSKNKLGEQWHFFVGKNGLLRTSQKPVTVIVLKYELLIRNMKMRYSFSFEFDCNGMCYILPKHFSGKPFLMSSGFTLDKGDPELKRLILGMGHILKDYKSEHFEHPKGEIGKRIHQRLHDLMNAKK